MIIDGVNFQAQGVCTPDRRGPSRSAAAVKQLIKGAPGAWRRIRLGRDAPAPLRIAVNGSVGLDGDSLSQLQGRIDELKYRTRPDKELTLAWSDTPGREFLGYRERLNIEDIPPDWVSPAVRFDFSMVCPVPFARDDSLQTTQDATPNKTPPTVLTPTVGTAPYPLVITITGDAVALTNPVLHYRNGADADIHTLSYVGTLGAADTLVIDTEAQTALKNGSNVAGDMTGTYFLVNPGDGDYLGSPNGPDVQLTADSGNHDLFKLEYRRRWQ